MLSGGGLYRVLVAVALAVFLLAPIKAGGADISSEQAKRRYQALKDELKAREQELNRAENLEGSALREIEITDRDLVKASQNLKKISVNINRTMQRMTGVESDIKKINQDLESARQWMRRKLRALYRYGRHGDELLLLGSSEDLSQMIRRWRYLEALAGHDKEIIDNYSSMLESLMRKRADLDALQSQYQVQKKEIADARASLEQKKRVKESVLVRARQDKAMNERLIRELRRSSARMQKIIMQSSRKASDNYAESGDFRKGKGKLAWPVEGRVIIPYGKQKDQDFDTPVFRNGIYIEAPEGNVARAVFGGKVVYADWFEGYGQLIIVNHGNGYHTLYGSLSEIFLKTGDIIKGKDKIGTIGESGVAGRPSLYFELRYKGKPLDPEQWLAKKK